VRLAGARVFVRAFNFADAVDELGPRVGIRGIFHRVGAGVLPGGHTQKNLETGRAPGEQRFDVEGGKLRVVGKVNDAAAGHDGAQAFKPDAAVLQFVPGQARLDDAIRVRKIQAAFRAELVVHRFLHPLQMLRLQKKPFVPVDFK